MLVEPGPVSLIVGIFKPDEFRVYDGAGNIRLFAKSGKRVVDDIHPVVWLGGLVYVKESC